jgi:hypothetical protein
MQLNSHWLSWVMLFTITIIFMALAIIMIFDKLRAEKRRSYELCEQFRDITIGTGFPNTGMASGKHFVQYLERHGFENPNVKRTPEYTIYDLDLNNLLNTAVDMSKGRGNMDVGIAFMADMDKVLDRLNPQNAPHNYGTPKTEG